MTYNHEQSADSIAAWLQVWVGNALSLPPESVDTTANFDELGLDSLAILTATGELAEWLDIELEAAVLFQHSTIDALAQHLG